MRLLYILLLCSLYTFSQSKAQIYKDPSASIEERVQDLLSRMTLDEKIAQMNMRSLKDLQFDKNGQATDSSLFSVFGKDGIGFLESPFTQVEDVGKRGLVADIYHRERTRLGIPCIQIGECLHGQLALGATIFPQAIAQGSTWNPALIEEMANIIAIEASASGVDQALSPLFDLGRDPRFGRIEECYGEDAYHVSRMGVAFVKGMQGDPIQTQKSLTRNKLICTAKHFAGYSVPIAGMNIAPSSIGEREMRSLHLPPFESVVKEGNIYAIMPSYNEVDGVPAHSNHWLLQTILRDEWGFQGMVFSDYCGIMMLKDLHFTAESAQEGARQALEAGVDVEAPSPWGYGTLKELLSEGLDPTLIDSAVARVLRIKFKAGLFEKPYINPSQINKIVHTPQHIHVAQSIAEESVILLKNEKNILPLDKHTVKSIAVIGPNANQVQFGDYSPTKNNKYGITVLEGIRGEVGLDVQINYAKGCGITELNKDGFEEAIDVATQSDLVVLVMGGTSAPLSGIGWGEDDPQDAPTCGEGFDRTELDFPGVQSELIKAIHTTGKPIILIMIHGRPYTINWEKENIPAILEAWYPGEQGGIAISNILFGKVNPSGRLPVSVPQSVGHVPFFYDHKFSGTGYYNDPGSKEKPGHNYVFSTPEPLFPFGYGLSYTTFSYNDLKIQKHTYKAGEPVHISMRIKNTGARAGKEVVQLYIRDLVSSTTTPVKKLRAFRKVELNSGEEQEIEFTLSPEDFELWNSQMQRVIEPGEFEIMIGQSSQNILLRKKIVLE